MNFKDIHIGSLINQRVKECEIKESYICSFFKCTKEEINKIYEQQSISSGALLKWCRLLKYDFFRIYSQHLILYAPSSTKINKENFGEIKVKQSQFRKNIYTREVIDFILEQIHTKKMTNSEVIERYKIPKTTLFKWIKKNDDAIYNTSKTNK